MALRSRLAFAAAVALAGPAFAQATDMATHFIAVRMTCGGVLAGPLVVRDATARVVLRLPAGMKLVASCDSGAVVGPATLAEDFGAATFEDH